MFSSLPAVAKSLSIVAQRKSTGLITQGSLDRNEAVLFILVLPAIVSNVVNILGRGFFFLAPCIQMCLQGELQ